MHDACLWVRAVHLLWGSGGPKILLVLGTPACCCVFATGTDETNLRARDGARNLRGIGANRTGGRVSPCGVWARGLRRAFGRGPIWYMIDAWKFNCRQGTSLVCWGMTVLEDDA